MSFEEKLAARKNAKPRHVDVDVILDVDVSAEVAELEAQIAEAKKNKRLSKSDGSKDVLARLEQLRAEAAESLFTLRFEPVAPDLWSTLTTLTAENLPRTGVLIDNKYGYNIDVVIRDAAPHSGGLLEGDTVTPLTGAQWADLFETISGGEFGAIRDAIWGLNEWDPEQRVEAAKKARAASATNSK